MRNLWILAQADQDTEGTTISSDQADSSQIGGDQIDSSSTPITSADGSNSDISGEQLPPPKAPTWMTYAPIVLLMIVMYMLLFRGPRKKQQQHQTMVQSLKPNDRVRTIGGIFGTVISVKEDEIILKIDESNNTKIKVLPQAISKLSSDNTN